MRIDPPGKALRVDTVKARLRGPSAKHFWDSLEQLGARLEELGVGDEEVEDV